jgi:transcriptional regulator with XRE-family HTH domain
LWFGGVTVQEVTRLVQTFGDTLRRLRTEAGITQGDLVTQANWSHSRISRTEQNLFSPDEATVVRLDRALNANGQLITAHTGPKAPSSELHRLGFSGMAT